MTNLQKTKAYKTTQRLMKRDILAQMNKHQLLENYYNLVRSYKDMDVVELKQATKQAEEFAAQLKMRYNVDLNNK